MVNKIQAGGQEQEAKMAIPREEEEKPPVATWKGTWRGRGTPVSQKSWSRRDSFLETVPRLIRKEIEPELAGHWG